MSTPVRIRKRRPSHITRKRQAEPIGGEARGEARDPCLVITKSLARIY